MSNIDLSKEPIIQAKSFFWAIRQVLELPDRQEAQRIGVLLTFGNPDPVKIKRAIKAVRERQALKVLVERVESYNSKREACLTLFKRTGEFKWAKQALFYRRLASENLQTLTKIYLERRRKIRTVEKQFGVSIRG